MENIRPQVAGRGAAIRPPSRFDTTTRVLALDTVEVDAPTADPHPDTQFLPDSRTKSVVTENDSPDIGFRFSVNPYRGCEHGCTYCYARPTHEFLGYDVVMMKRWTNRVEQGIASSISERTTAPLPRLTGRL